MAALLKQHGLRIAITLLPMLLGVLHATGRWPLPLVQGLDRFIYDARLRASMPRTLDPRIVIVDIDDASLQRVGHWPWSRDKLARLATELTQRQQAAVLGFDVMFVEPDDSAGLGTLRALAQGPLRGDAGFAAELQRLAPALDGDAAFARALAGGPVALGYYFTRTGRPQAKGQLPAPPLPPGAFPAGHDYATRWNGFGAPIAPLAQAARASGFVNSALNADDDGVLRSAPLLARYEGTEAAPGYYESLGLAVYRLARGGPPLAPVFAADGPGQPAGAPALESLQLGQGDHALRVPVDPLAAALVPFRGPGGPGGGSFRYVSAADVLDGKLAEGELRGRIVLVGTTAPGLQDLTATPVSAAYPGVEVHANIVSGLLDRRLPGVPDYAPGYDLAQLLLAGLVLALGLTLLPAHRAVLLTLAVAAALAGLNTLLYRRAGLVLPLAAALLMTGLAFALNMSWGYLVEARARRGLARLFGTYVPPELVDEMLAQPGRYSMRAQSKELTVMFCDMRGFTRRSEQMAPVELQAFLNGVFSRLTEIIRAHRGTVDKYMGDCVMAFWGAPVDMPDHAERAVRAALELDGAARDIDAALRAEGQPGLAVGIGLNTGPMSVGDMGSAVRRSYTVVGDAVNLAARLEGLGPHYGVAIVASAATQQAAPGFLWQELDRVRVRGRAQAVAIATPRGPLAPPPGDAERQEVALWTDTLAAYRAQDWSICETMLATLRRRHPGRLLYALYAQRAAARALQPGNPAWDDATPYDTK